MSGLGRESLQIYARKIHSHLTNLGLPSANPNPIILKINKINKKKVTFISDTNYEVIQFGLACLNL